MIRFKKIELKKYLPKVIIFLYNSQFYVSNFISRPKNNQKNELFERKKQRDNQFSSC